jgi:Heterokaryon incompatibility protein Het-C
MLSAIQQLTYLRRVLYAWEHPGVPVDEVMNDILRAFHHPALRDESLELHRNMFNTVRKWVEEQPDAHNLNSILSSSSVRAGHNHKTSGERDIGHSHGALGGHGKTSGSIWTEIQSRDLGALEGADGNPSSSYMTSSPQPGSPHKPPHSPNFGYQNVPQRPGSSNDMPHGGYLSPEPAHGQYQSGPPPSDYRQGYGGPQGGYQHAPYPVEQPPHGAPPPQPPYGQPPYGQGWSQGPPPGGFPGGPPPPQPPYGQPPYGPGYQYPPGQPGGGYGY